MCAMTWVTTWWDPSRSALESCANQTPKHPEVHHEAQCVWTSLVNLDTLNGNLFEEIRLLVSPFIHVILYSWTDAHMVTESIPRWWFRSQTPPEIAKGGASLVSTRRQELRLSDEIGKYVLENPLRRMTKAQGCHGCLGTSWVASRTGEVGSSLAVHLVLWDDSMMIQCRFNDDSMMRFFRESTGIHAGQTVLRTVFALPHQRWYPALRQANCKTLLEIKHRWVGNSRTTSCDDVKYWVWGFVCFSNKAAFWHTSACRLQCLQDGPSWRDTLVVCIQQKPGDVGLLMPYWLLLLPYSVNGFQMWCVGSSC